MTADVQHGLPWKWETVRKKLMTNYRELADSKKRDRNGLGFLPTNLECDLGTPSR